MSHKNHVAPISAREVDDLEDGSWKVKREHSAFRKEKKTEMIIKEKRQKADKFDSFYKQLGSKVIPEEKRIDYVLVYPEVNLKEIEDEDDKADAQRIITLREKFEDAMKSEGLLRQKIIIEDLVYTKIHCPFRRLCEEAELVSLEMPLAGCESEHKEEPNKLTDWVTKHLKTDNEIDMVSAPFVMERMHLYQDHDDPTNFFRPSIRSLLTEHILINIDLRKTGVSGKDYKSTKPKARSVGNCWGCIKDDSELGDMQKVGLDYMLMEKVYTEKFILHEESMYDPDEKEKNKTLPTDPASLKADPRFDMQLTWVKFFKFQPLWKIRNYFGEKIGFYFAWSGTLIETLWLPMLFGFAIFIYGLVESIKATSSGSTENENNSTVSDLFRNVKESFDNDVTPYFALFICVWGTLFIEVWKRRQAELAYKWDVEQFEEYEPDRPEFYGTKQRVDPVTNEQDWYYPFTRKAWKLFLSTMTILFMVCLVLISVVSVIVYRTIARVDYCPDLPDSECLFVTTIVSSLFNAISILILGKVYDILARKLTDWENHRTQTMYNDALIIKLFAFQFVNNYSSCFYIAFFRGRFDDDNGILGRGSKYQDNCEGTCMSQLSFQVMVLMITKPLPKLATDILLPWGMKLFRKYCKCCACIPFVKRFLKLNDKPKEEKTLLELEIEKPPLGNFTLGEYTEKVIQYGLMMLFAASFPLAPLLVLLLNVVDLRLDAWRMLWAYQRPMAVIAEDIGTWQIIITFINFVGVVSNAFLVAFTANWGEKYDTAGKLWIVIGFEHIVFSLKFLVAYLIPDTPASVVVALRKKRYQLEKVLEDDKMKDVGYVKVTTTTKVRQNDEDTTRNRKPRSNFVNEEDTEVRRLKKKSKKDEPNDHVYHEIEQPDYTKR
ncbi:hypothetical protein ACF0H5_011077 [Mactra antiquata]